VIPLDKTLFANDLFWSVKDGFKIETKKLIQAYLSQYSEGDIMGLYSLFGYKRVLSDALKLYKKRTNKDYQKIRDILQRIEIWRFDDKRDR